MRTRVEEGARRSLPIATVIAVAVVVTLGGCGSDVGGPDGAALRTAVRDSAGLRIVENSVQDLPTRVTRPEPILSIGSLEDGPDALFRVRAVGRLSDGSWVVGNSGTLEVRIFDTAGGYLRSVGGEGEGPGEFQFISGVTVLPGDSLQVWDFRQRRGSVFGPDGALARTFTPEPGEGQSSAAPVGRLAGGRLVMAGSSIFGSDLGSEEVVRPTTVNSIADAEGKPITVLGELPGSEQWLVQGDGFISIRSVPFAKGSSVDATGSHAIAGITERAEFTVWDADGVEVERWRWDVPTPQVSDADWEAARNEEIQRVAEDPDAARNVREFYEQVARPEGHPAWSSLLVAADGSVWVESFVPPGQGGETVRWWVFDDTGEIVDAVDLPSDLNLLWADEGLVAGTVTDDFDVEYLRVYEVGPGG